MRLSKRLETVISLVQRGNAAVDVGCDHAFVPIELVSRKIAPFAAACDVREGPIASARDNISKSGLSGSVLTVLADGVPRGIGSMLNENFGAVKPEGYTLILAGMGGLLMREICMNAGPDLDLFTEIVASPQRNVREFRHFLKEKRFRIEDERFLREDGKYYPVIKACRADTADEPEETPAGSAKPDVFEEEMQDSFGPVLIRKRDPDLIQYLTWRRKLLDQILSSLPPDGKRREEILHDMKLVNCALSSMEVPE